MTKAQDDDVYDELVIDQEGQVIPALILEFNQAELQPAAMKFAREVLKADKEKEAEEKEEKKEKMKMENEIEGKKLEKDSD